MQLVGCFTVVSLYPSHYSESQPVSFCRTEPLPWPGIARGWRARGSNPGGGEIFRPRPDRPWGPPSLLYNGYRVCPGGKAAGAWR